MTVAELIEELRKIPGHKEVRASVLTDYDDDPIEPAIMAVVYRGCDVILETDE